MKTKPILVLIIFLVIAISGMLLILINKENTSANNQLRNSGMENREIKFNLQKPDEKIKLPLEFKEISALSYYKNNQLVCLNDEKADIFLINYLTENMDQKIPIARKGDFEGIEIVDNAIYLLESNGVLIKIVDFMNESRVIKEYKTGLSLKNDCEGLGFDPITQKLLIACKSNPVLPGSSKQSDKTGISYKNKRAVYEYDISTQKLIKDAKYLISLKEIKKKTGQEKFMPSGIAVHPITHNIYLIASVGKLLIVLNRAGKIIDFSHLDPKVFRQPEGICFSPDGNKLFISNEGRNRRGNVLVFD